MIFRRSILTMLLIGFVSAAMPKHVCGQDIAVLDVARVFEDFEMTRDLEAMFDDRQREVATEAESRRKSIEQMRRAIAAFDPDSEDFARREQDLLKAEADFQVWSAYQERRLKTEHKNWLMNIYHRTQDVVASIAKQRNFDLVLTYDRLVEDAPDSSSLRQQILLQKVIYHSDRVDITDEVLKQINQRYQADGGIQTLANRRPQTRSSDQTAKP